jgi:hypothetical protein
MKKFNEDVEGRSGLVHLSECEGCPAYLALPALSGLGKQGFKGRCVLNRDEERRLPVPVNLRLVPCMDRDLAKKRFGEWNINKSELK